MHARSLFQRMLAASSPFVLAGSVASAQSTVNPSTIEIYQLGPEYAFYNSTGTYATAYGFTTVSTSPFTLISTRSTGYSREESVSNNAFVNYYFMMLGLPGIVTATFTADMFVGLSDRSIDEVTRARAYFTLSSAGSGNFYDPSGRVLTNGPLVDFYSPEPGTRRFNTPVAFTVDANVMYMVTLFAGTQTRTPGLVAEASIDPAITISAAQQSAYSLVLSPGISNLLPNASTTVPEPASSVLVGAGLLGVAAVVRRRQVA